MSIKTDVRPALTNVHWRKGRSGELRPPDVDTILLFWAPPCPKNVPAPLVATPARRKQNTLRKKSWNLKNQLTLFSQRKNVYTHKNKQYGIICTKSLFTNFYSNYFAQIEYVSCFNWIKSSTNRSYSEDRLDIHLEIVRLKVEAATVRCNVGNMFCEIKLWQRWKTPTLCEW